MADPMAELDDYLEEHGGGANAEVVPIVKIVTAKQFVGSLEPPSYVLDGILQRGYLYSCTALTGDGKTAVALLLAFCIAREEHFGDKETERGKVLYLAGENAQDVKIRVAIMADQLGLDLGDLDIIFIGDRFDIKNTYDLIAQQLEKHGPVILVIVDTAAAFFDGEDENSNKQQGDFARQLRSLTEWPGNPTILVTSHPVKNASKENLIPRGGGAFLNEVDGNLTLYSEDKETTELHWLGKFRGPPFNPISFRLEHVSSDLVKDAKGRHIPSVMATVMSEKDVEQQSRAVRSDQDTLLKVMTVAPNGSFADWARACEWFSTRKSDNSQQPARWKVERVLKELKKDRLVKKYRGDWVLTEEGKKEGERFAREDGL